MKRVIFSLGLLCLYHLPGNAQTAVNTTLNILPQVGQKMPDFELEGVQQFEKKTVTLSDFKGKWLVLDCWNRYCGSCVESMPKINEFNKRYGQQMQFIMVGYNGSQYGGELADKAIRADFEKYKTKYDLTFPAAFDSTIFHRFSIYSCPHIFIIDPSGIVRGITYMLTKENIEDFLAGKQPKLPRAWRKGENKITYEESRPFLIDGNNGAATDYIYRSVISPYKDYMHGQYQFRIRGNQMQVMGVDLASLYRYAYTGSGYIAMDEPQYDEYYRNVLLELADSSLFKPNRNLRTNIFCYSIELPEGRMKESNIRKILQRDLKNCFGYAVTIEKRKMPVQALVKVAKVAPVAVKNVNATSSRFRTVKGIMAYYFNATSFGSGIPIFDQTGITGEFDIEVHCDFNDLNDIRRALREHGFDVISIVKEMKVVVIKDDKDEM